MKEAAIILAAGRGERMGLQNKASLQHQGRSFFEWIVSALRRRGIEEIVAVIAQPHLEATLVLANAQLVGAIENPAPDRGMSSSIALGFAHAHEQFSAEVCWLWPVDTPLVRDDTLAALALAASRETATRPSFGPRGGHPVLVGRWFWSSLVEGAAPDGGARAVFARVPERLVSVPVTDAGVTRDVDTLSDLAAL